MAGPKRFTATRLRLVVIAHAAWMVVLGASQTPADAAPPEPVKVTVGVFMSNIPKVNMVSNSFKFNAYVWFRWDPAAWPPKVQQATPPVGANAAASPDETTTAFGGKTGGGDLLAPSLSGPAATFEIISADGQLVKTPLYLRPGYCCLQVEGERTTFWNVRNFPFDKQRIDIVIEDGSFDAREMLYEPDMKGSGISPGLIVTGFRLSHPTQTVDQFVYETTFGDPALETSGTSPYSRYTFSIPMRRDSWGLFFKLFSGLFVCTTIAMIALFINPMQVDPRFGLCVGGLFGIIGNSYLVSSLLPETSELCYADMLNIIALVMVLLVVIESAFSLSLHLNRGEAGAALAKRLDRWTFVALFVAFAGATIFLTIQAM